MLPAPSFEKGGKFEGVDANRVQHANVP